MLFEVCPMHTSAAATSEDDRHLMMINASPMEYGHCLLVPSVSSCLPQVLIIIVRARKKSVGPSGGQVTFHFSLADM